jgi:hypothetical protein
MGTASPTSALGSTKDRRANRASQLIGPRRYTPESRESQLTQERGTYGKRNRGASSARVRRKEKRRSLLRRLSRTERLAGRSRRGSSGGASKPSVALPSKQPELKSRAGIGKIPPTCCVQTSRKRRSHSNLADPVPGGRFPHQVARSIGSANRSGFAKRSVATSRGCRPGRQRSGFSTLF